MRIGSSEMLVLFAVVAIVSNAALYVGGSALLRRLLNR
jgi:hypothetical protein